VGRSQVFTFCLYGAVWTVIRKLDRAFEAVGVEVRGEVTGEVGPSQTQGQSQR
jgi:hypothetical protein